MNINSQKLCKKSFIVKYLPIIV